MSRAPLADLDREGYAVVTGVLNAPEIETLIAALDDVQTASLMRGNARFGARNLLDVPAVQACNSSPVVRELVEAVLGPSARPVRALLFDKVPGANWPVPWHQDLSLAVAERRDIAGWGTWAEKAGVPHVQPPAAVLAELIAIRLHLDANDTDNGPLRVIPRTHCGGRLSRERIANLRLNRPAVSCTTERGDALVMRPLLLHASSPAKAPRRRRVVHIEFAPQGLLPAPLAWAH